MTGALYCFDEPHSSVCADMQQEDAGTRHVTGLREVSVFWFCGIRRDYHGLFCRSAFVVIRVLRSSYSCNENKCDECSAAN